MQKLGLDDEVLTEIPKKFWPRQFQAEATSGQRKFDWVFGIVLPVICFYFDPIVFTGGFDGGGMLAAYKPFAYVLTYVSIMSMMAWLIWGARLGWLNSAFAGLFAVGSLVSLAVGIFIAPISLLGLIVVIGALGFTPLFSAFVYLRNSTRAFRAGKDFLEGGLSTRTFALGAIFSAVIPYVAHLEIVRLGIMK